MSLMTRALGGGIKGLYHDVGALSVAMGRDTWNAVKVAKSTTIENAMAARSWGELGGALGGWYRSPIGGAGSIGSLTGMIAGGYYGATSDRHPWLYGLGGAMLGSVAGTWGGYAFGNRNRLANLGRAAWRGGTDIGGGNWAGMRNRLGTMGRATRRAWNRW